MKKVLSFLVGLIGLHFVPENHRAAVMRLGMYNRALGPGFIWIIPFVERVENLVKIGVRFATFPVRQVFSSNGIPFDFELVIRYRFDPDSTSRPIAAQLVRLPDHALEDILKDYADKSLRRTIARYSAEDIYIGGPIADIEQGVIGGLTTQVRHLGLAPMAGSGVMIKEITPPEDFRKTILVAKEYQIIIRVITAYQTEDIDHDLLAKWVRSFKDTPPTSLSSLVEFLARMEASKGEESVLIRLQTDRQIETFGEAEQRDLIEYIAHLTKTPKEAIKLVYVIPGSVLVTLEMPEDGAMKFMRLYLHDDPAISELGINKVELRPALPPPTDMPQLSAQSTSRSRLDYEHGLRRMRELLMEQAPQLLNEFHTLEARLLDNLEDERLFGISEIGLTNRARVISSLNELMIRAGLENSFMDLCRRS